MKRNFYIGVTFAVVLIALEIGSGQQPAIDSLLIEAGFSDVQFTPDLQGIPRVAAARRL